MPKQNTRKIKRLMERKFKRGIISEDEMNEFNNHVSINQKITQFNKQKKYNDQQVEQTKKDIENDIQKIKSIRVNIPKSQMIIHYVMSIIGQYLLLVLNTILMILFNSYLFTTMIYFVIYGLLFYKHILSKSYYDINQDTNQENNRMGYLEGIDNKILPYCMLIYNSLMMIANNNYLTLIMYLIGNIRQMIRKESDQTNILVGMIYHILLLFNMNGYIIFGMVTMIYMKYYNINYHY